MCAWLVFPRDVCVYAFGAEYTSVSVLKVLRWYASACVCFHLSLQYGIAWGKGSNCVTRGGVRLWRSFVTQGGQMCSVRGKRSFWLLCPQRSNWELDAQVYITLLFQQLLTKLLHHIISGACFLKFKFESLQFLWKIYCFMDLNVSINHSVHVGACMGPEAWMSMYESCARPRSSPRQKHHCSN